MLINILYKMDHIALHMSYRINFIDDILNHKLFSQVLKYSVGGLPTWHWHHMYCTVPYHIDAMLGKHMHGSIPRTSMKLLLWQCFMVVRHWYDM